MAQALICDICGETFAYTPGRLRASSNQSNNVIRETPTPSLPTVRWFGNDVGEFKVIYAVFKSTAMQKLVLTNDVEGKSIDVCKDCVRRLLGESNEVESPSGPEPEGTAVG